eukprot:9929800-Ditylum_brightwellii.AAC.1
MMIGKDTIFLGSTKQKINTKDSTKAKIVGVDDTMPHIIWTCYFMEVQGYEISDNIVYQDNESAMRLEKNEKGSSSKRTRHIDIRYFFVTDHIAAEDLAIEYCPKGRMLSNFFTKLLQGKAFCTFYNMVMNVNLLQPREAPLKLKQKSS